jgi:hypothetical protein
MSARPEKDLNCQKIVNDIEEERRKYGEEALPVE